MEEKVELVLPNVVTTWVKEVATIAKRDFQEILIDLIISGLEGVVSHLSDDQVKALANLKMSEAQAEELGELLTQQREREISTAGRIRLRELLDIYEYGMLWKAEGQRVGVQRGILPPMHS